MADELSTFPLTGPINLQARLGAGAVVVEAHDELAEASVRITARRENSDIVERIAVELRGPTLTVTAPRSGGLPDLFAGRDGGRDAVDVVIQVPSGTAVRLSTTSAEITVTGRCGGADLSTGSGAITADTVDGDLRLRYGSSRSTVQTVTGDVSVKSGAGNAHFGRVDGNLQAGFGSGNLEVGVAHGQVRSRAGSGDATISAAYGDVDFGAGSGTVSVGLPHGTSTRLDISTGSGKVRSELPIEDSPAGERQITVRARTGSGDVRLFRAA